MQFLDSAGVRQFKQYNDSKYVVTEDVSTIDTPTRDTYTKDEIDNMLDGLIESEADPIFTASAASGITSNDITSWNGKQDSISDLAAIRSGAALGATSVQTETDPTVPAWAKAATKPTYTAAEVGALPANTSIPSKTSDLTNDSGYIDTETDPVFSASVAAGITSSDITNWNSKTSNTGTITGITMNGASKGTSGVVDLGTVITAHQDISGKADKSAAIGSLSLSLNSTDYKITLSGTKVDGTTFTVSDVIDLPLESVVVNGSYDDTTKKVVLTLKNGNTVDFSIADLIAGLQSEITSTNKLSADLIADGTTNKVVTATEKSTWNGKQDAISDLATIRSNAEAGAAKVSNVQSDWNATTGAAVILNKPTIPSAVTESTVTGWGFAKTASPSLTGTPTAPTATAGTNTTQIATTAFVKNAVDSGKVIKIYEVEPTELSKNAIYSSLPSGFYDTAVSDIENGYIPIIRCNIGEDVLDLIFQFYFDSQELIAFTAIATTSIYYFNLGKTGILTQYRQVTIENNDLKVSAWSATTNNSRYPSEKLVKDSLDLKQDAITSTNKLDYSLIDNTPTIPSAVTESTVSGWGFTKNTGTVTQVKVGNTSYDPSSGVVSLPAYPTSLPASDVSAWAKASSKPTYTASEVGALPSTTVIPDAANNATITIQKGGTTVDSFTVNASSNKTINIPNELPSYSSSDSGKILSVNSSGQLVWITPANIYSGSATPNANTGNNGDIYLQS